MDIIIVLDGSNSIYPWYEVQNFLSNILSKFFIDPEQIQVSRPAGFEQQSLIVLYAKTAGKNCNINQIKEGGKGVGKSLRRSVQKSAPRTLLHVLPDALVEKMRKFYGLEGSLMVKRRQASFFESSILAWS